MQPKLKPKKNILRALKYNEQKVTEGKAQRISAENFLKDHDRLTREEIIDRFRQRTSLNELLHDDGIHISLNFGKQEMLDTCKMAQLADRYMTGMGFDEQPYVAYQHYDAGHTHLHIVVTAARADGSKIELHPKDYVDSCALCKKLEREYALERLVGARQADQPAFAVEHAQKVRYGEPGLKRAISDVLNTVVDHYKYTSLDEYNAILKQYNVTANPGLEGSRLRQMHGLLYHALDEDGNRIGVPIKASLFLLKPTLKKLEQRFEQNQSLRESSRERISTAIEWALAGRAPDWEKFREDLEKEGITIMAVTGTESKDQLFFVDHVEKCAFAGKSLRGDYGPESLRNRCAPEERIKKEQIISQKLNLGI